MAAQLHWLIEVEAEQIVGALGYDTSDGVAVIDRLVVDPGHHRRGTGRRLVMRFLTEGDGGGAIVSTGRENGPARWLYETAGFIHVADREVLPGLVVSDYATASVTKNTPGIYGGGR
ncbi:GNAT family N-acetyltransferase [Microbacterium sp. A8/3-1]|uniref:GNAT family N-acetyltransferase n=1 Tax=Microbacterium sp. A8/3-1 TaxID=3160749 RepID=A0AAU7W1Q5_9MICO